MSCFVSNTCHPVHLLEHLTGDEFRDIAGRGLLVVPLGAVEQHGGHLPFGTDALLAGAIAIMAAERARVPVVVAPTLPYGSSDHHIPVGGAISLQWPTLARVLADILTSASRSGFARVLLLNGHGGNAAVMREVATERARSLGIEVSFLSYWELVDEAPSAVLPGHAGRFETALVLAVAPDLVRLERARAPRGDAAEIFGGPPWSARPDDWMALGGVSDHAEGASAAEGRQLLEHIADALAHAFDQLEAPAV